MGDFEKLVQSILEGKDPVGMDTYWQDGDIKVTIKDVIKYLDSNNTPVKEVSIDKIKPVIIDQDYKGAAKDRVEKADLRYPLIVAVKDSKYKSILDGNHRAFKALRDKVKTVKVREIDLDSEDTPESYKALFS
jgi:hydrogenase maturation factor HypE